MRKVGGERWSGVGYQQRDVTPSPIAPMENLMSKKGHSTTAIGRHPYELQHGLEEGKRLQRTFLAPVKVCVTIWALIR